MHCWFCFSTFVAAAKPQPTATRTERERWRLAQPLHRRSVPGESHATSGFVDTEAVRAAVLGRSPQYRPDHAPFPNTGEVPLLGAELHVTEGEEFAAAFRPRIE